MAIPKQPELGIRSPFRVRYGMTHATCLGVYRQPDPGAIPPNALWDGVNVRINISFVEARGGQSKVNSTQAATGGIMGMAALGIEGVPGLLLSGGAFPTVTYGPIIQFQSTQTPSLFYITGGTPPLGEAIGVCNAYNEALARRALINFKDVILAFVPSTTSSNSAGHLCDFSMPEVGDQSGNTTKFRRVFNIGERPSSFAVLTERIVATNSGLVDAMADVLYIGSTFDGNVYKWDGLALEQIAVGLGSGRTVVFVYHGRIFVTGNNYVKVGQLTGSAWLWTTVPIPGGVVSWRPCAAQEFKNSVYLGGYDLSTGIATILQLDEDVSTHALSLSIPHTFSLGFSPHGPDEAVADVEVHGGNLYYILNPSNTDPTSNPRIGKYDGTAWNDSFLVFTATIGSALGALLSTGGNLWVCTYGGSPASPPVGIFPGMVFDVFNSIPYQDLSFSVSDMIDGVTGVRI